MANIIGILGFINSGKSTVASRLVHKHDFRQDSFATSLKDACASIFGWSRTMLEGDTKDSREWREHPDEFWADRLGIADFSPRLALQLMGTDIIRDHFCPDMWLLTVENRIRKTPDRSVVISDVRFSNEIAFIRSLGGTLVKVSRGDNPVWYETACMANRGNPLAKDVMKTVYASTHASEWAWAGADVDHVLDNNGTLDDLYMQIDNLV